MTTSPPLIVHVVYRFGVGGLENGIVNLINRMSHHRWRHAIVALTEDLVRVRRANRASTTSNALRSRSVLGTWCATIPACWGCSRSSPRRSCIRAISLRWKPSSPHGPRACRCAFTASMAGTCRIRSASGSATATFGDCIVPSSPITSRSRVTWRTTWSSRSASPASASAQIYNGVDTDRFFRAPEGRAAIPGCPFHRPDQWLVGTVGRLESVKDPLNLARAFVRTLEHQADARRRLRLIVVGGWRIAPAMRRRVQSGRHPRARVVRR